jgi:acetyl-CoA carboxylase carboxyl transferase subunit beta
MLFTRDLEANLNVCYHCGHHLKLSVMTRLDLLFDDGVYHEVPQPNVPHDPLKFKDRKKYTDRLKEARAKTGRQDAIVVAKGTIGGVAVVAAAFNFEFMGGSMGAAVGEGLLTAAREAVKEKAALLAIPASGGARMQEGALSLMQLPRTIVAVELVKKANLPYIVLLTDPTTGGVSASFAMVGDIHLAEPGCMIGFAGKRVIQETIREELPPGFQTSEYLLDHGMVDMVVERKDLPMTISKILNLLMHPVADAKTAPLGHTDTKGGFSGKMLRRGKGANTRASVVDLPVQPRRKADNDDGLKDSRTSEAEGTQTNDQVADPAPSSEKTGRKATRR